MRDVLRERMLRANALGVNWTGFSGCEESEITGVEVFTFFKVLCWMVGFGGELAVEAEESLLVRREGLRIMVRKRLWVAWGAKTKSNSEVAKCLRWYRSCSADTGS
jgi:hypothetical protein